MLKEDLFDCGCPVGDRQCRKTHLPSFTLSLWRVTTLLMWKQQVRLLSWLWNLDQGNFASLGPSFFCSNPQCVS